MHAPLQKKKKTRSNNTSEPQAEAPEPREAWHAPPGVHSLPAHLKTGVEQLSGLDMSDVRVHYNSPNPAQLQAKAYAQGNRIHLGPGHVASLPHEAWHVVQQKQGRVQANLQMKGLAVNNSESLEREADTMGARAQQVNTQSAREQAAFAPQQMRAAAQIQSVSETIQRQKATATVIKATSPGDVVQMDGDDALESYDEHPTLAGDSSKWDNSNKKDAIWEQMERDKFQADTSDFLGTDQHPTPTTHHILAKAKVPKLEFNIGNLRLGVAGDLRVDDPGQAPDYNMAQDGSMTPRSKRIAQHFERGDTAELQKAVDEAGHRPYTQADYDQWYITKDHWDRIAADWDGKDRFWDDHATPYYSVDYSKKSDKGHKSAATVLGIPWSATKDIKAADKSKFKDVKKFLARGSMAANPRQKGILDSFRPLRALTIEAALQETGLQADFVELMKKAKNSKNFLNGLIKDTEKDMKRTAGHYQQAIGGFNEKQADAGNAFKAHYHAEELKWLGQAKESWNEDIPIKEKRIHNSVIKQMQDELYTNLATQEAEWLKQYKDAIPDTDPYSLTGEERKQHILARLKVQLKGSMTEEAEKYGAEASPDWDQATETHFSKLFTETVEEATHDKTQQIAAFQKKQESGSFSYNQIMDDLKKTHGFSKISSKNRDLPKNYEQDEALKQKAAIWLKAETWHSTVMQDPDPKPPKEAHKELYKLLTKIAPS